MRIDQILSSGDGPVFSFEFFPPKTPEGEKNLFAAIEQLRPLDPAYVSVTYGAGGSTRGKTLEIVSRIRDDYGLEAMAHFTCVGATVGELRATLDEMASLGFDNVLALRGDPPPGAEEWTKTEGGLEYSAELVELIRSDYDFAIGAAAFPETHIHATSPDDDLRHLKTKVDAGVDFLITQLFFDNAVYFDFVARARAIGVDVPIIPGILPITNVAQLQRITSLCGSALPEGAAPRARCSQRRRPSGLRFRRGLCHAPVRRAAGGRCARNPLLHAQPLTGDAGDPQRAEAAAPLGIAARGGHRARPLVRERLDVEPFGDSRHAVGPRPAHVDRVVLPVGADAPRAQRPAPAADLVLAQFPAEHEAPPGDLVVGAERLGDAVQEHLERWADACGELDDGTRHRWQ